MSPTLAASLLAIRIGVLGIFAPTQVEIAALGVTHRVTLDPAPAGGLLVDGAARPSLRVSGAPLVEVRVLGPAGPRISRRFRGVIEARADGGQIRLVDELPDEEYLPGTVALEAQGDHPEAQRLQAVLARTVVARGTRHPGERFDLCDLTHCQTYRGADGETERAREATRSTAGQVVRAGGRVADVYFTSSCGGATADVADVWPDAGGTRPHRHLRSVGCAPCEHSATVAWRAEVALADLDRALTAGGRLTGLTVVERGAGGLARRVRLDGDGRTLSGEQLRIAAGRALGWNLIKSARFTVEPLAGRRLRLRGRGFGHGVGVCELGAATLARQGLDHRAILRRYLPGTDVGPR